MKKNLILVIWIILNILNNIFLVAGALVGFLFAVLGVISLIVFIIGIFLKIPNNIKYIGISLICFSIKFIVAIIYSIIQLGIDKIKESGDIR